MTEMMMEMKIKPNYYFPDKTLRIWDSSTRRPMYSLGGIDTSLSVWTTEFGESGRLP